MRAVLVVIAFLAIAPAARADTFALQHAHGGVVDADAQGDVTFPDAGGANVNLTLTDRDEDGWCADAWVTSNLPPATHKQYQVCGVAKQQTFALALPGGARCNIGFVEVQVGRVDPSNGDATELGEASRIVNPCPPLPAPAPPAPPAAVTARATWTWIANRRWTRNVSMKVAGIPAGASVELRCSGHGCPKRRAVTVGNGAADAHRSLGRRQLKPGAVLELRVWRGDMIGKVWRFKVRRRHTPLETTLCLPPGAAAPTRCG